MWNEFQKYIDVLNNLLDTLNSLTCQYLQNVTCDLVSSKVSERNKIESNQVIVAFRCEILNVRTLILRWKQESIESREKKLVFANYSRVSINLTLK